MNPYKRRSFIRKKVLDKLKSCTTCFYCKSPISTVHVDHIEPLYLEGTDDEPNLTPSCQRCNSFKGCFTIDEFLLRMIDKRLLLHNKTLSYINRCKRFRKRKSITSQDEAWLLNKIRLGRNECNYYTRVINSIINKTYAIYYA